MSEPKLSDLDRCIHGRHAVDNCFGCPDGWSTGNLFLADDQRIGTDIGGNPIHVGLVRRHTRDGDDRATPPIRGIDV